FFVYNSGKGSAAVNFVPMLGALVLIGGYEIYRYKKYKKLASIGILILIAGVSWTSIGLYQLFFLNLLIWIMYLIARRNLKVIVLDEHVIYPSFPPKLIKWPDINNLVLKDDILTIDLKNNKIYQHQVEYIDNAVNEPEFNDFCRTKLV
ncbi:MAG TPA: hypothetical protein VL943_10745, partial [Niabella sp.]|nr:hypothetical protein [Niabella sp.]